MKLKPLQPNDTIGIVAPSSPVSGHILEKQYARGISEIKKMGFKIKEGKTIHKKKWLTTGSDKARSADIMNMFSDKKIKAIICAVGGFGANRLLSHLDYALIKKNPKPFLGISDPTILLSGLFQKAQTPTIHGPDVCFGFGGDHNIRKKKWELSMVHQLLTNKNALGKIKPLTKWKVLKKGRGKGLLVGGHLNLYTGLKGTPFFADIKNQPKIFFWEATGSYLNIDRDLNNLKNMGFFNNVNGMIIGKFNLMSKNSENKKASRIYKDLILDTLSSFNFPIISEVDFGHLTPNIPIPYGKLAEVDGNKNCFSILQSIYK